MFDTELLKTFVAVAEHCQRSALVSVLTRPSWIVIADGNALVRVTSVTRSRWRLFPASRSERLSVLEPGGDHATLRSRRHRAHRY